MPTRADTDNWIFHGFANPNTTAVPDDFFDFLAPRLREGELRVVLYMIRRTYGFKKDQDDISLSQLMHGITTRDGRVLDLGTGLSKPAVINAVRSLVGHRVIIRTANQSAAKGFEATTYRLNRLERASGENTLVNEVYKGAGNPSLQALVNVDDIQETVIQQTEISSSNIRKSTRSKMNGNGETSQPHEEAPDTSAKEYRGIEDMAAILKRQQIETPAFPAGLTASKRFERKAQSPAEYPA